MNKRMIITTWCMILAVLLISPVIAGQNYEQPEFKLMVNSGWGAHSIGQLDVTNWLGYDGADLVELDGLYDLPNRLGIREKDHSDYSGQFGLGYNLIGNWYIIGGLQYEKWDENRDVTHTIDDWTGSVGYSYFKATAVIPFIAIEYSNRFWGLNYNSSIGLAECISKVNVSYIDLLDQWGSLGKYSYNSLGLILSGGLSYEFVRNTFISGQMGYRFFGGDKIEPPARSDSPAIDFDYDGMFYGIGMGYGFGGI